MSALGAPGWVVAGACLVLAVAGLVRLVLVEPTGRDVELTWVVMAGAMAAMAFSLRLPWWLWPALLLAATALSGYRLVFAGPDPHRSHRMHHIAAGLAMAWLLIAPRYASLAAVTLFGCLAAIGYLVGAAALAALSLTRLRPAPLPPVAPAPRVAAACQLLMSLLMVDMLIAML